jgi:protein involved in polysaccharide export with SLBB domain
MSILRTSCSLVMVVALLSGWVAGVGCRTASARKAGNTSTNAPATVVKSTKETPAPAKPAKITSNAKVDKSATAKPLPETTAVTTNKPGFFARLFGPKTAKTTSAKPETAVAVSKPPTIAGANVTTNTNKTYVPYRIQVNDTLIISLRGITPEQPNVEQVVDEHGEIKLAYINALKAEGRTPSELETLIRETYIEQKIYKRLTVNVIIPAQTQPTFYVKGEVRSPGRIPFVSGMTLLAGIVAAGGPTDFFTPNMTLLRGGKRIKFNYYDLEKYPDKDQPVQAGDIIVVDKSWF